MANNDYITTDCKLTVSKNTAKLDEEIFLYKNDRNIKLLIEIVDNKYRYKSDDLSNLLVKYKASYAQVKWYKNAEVKKEFPIQATDDGKVVFVIEGQLIDEDTELGDYDLQLRLLNESQESIRSLPIIKGAVHILKPLFEEGDIATVNSAVADVSMLSLDGDAIDTYNSDGTYNQTNWGNGDVISSAKLNKLEKVAKDNVDKVNKMPAKSIVEGGKIYLAKEDGTKLDSGTELPAGGSTIEVVNNLESDSTTAALSAAQGKALNTQYKDIVNKIENGGGGSTDANGISIQDIANNFTSTNVEGALAELFQFINTVAEKVKQIDSDEQLLYTFGLLSDVHVDGDGNDEAFSNSDLKNAISFLEKAGASFIAYAGDMTYNGRAEDYTALKTCLQTATIPNYCVRGNHDAYSLADGYASATGCKEDYIITQNNDLLIFISCADTNHDTGGLTTAKLDWLENLLKNNTNTRVFLFYHYFVDGTSGNGTGVYPYGTLKPSNAVALRFINMVKQYPNLIYCNGHSHMRFNIQDKDPNANYYHNDGECYYIHIPSTSKPRFPSGDTVADYYEGSEGYLVKVYANKVLFKPIDFIAKQYLTAYNYTANVAQGNAPTVPTNTIDITWNDGIKIDKSTGTETADNNYSASNFIACDPTKTYTLNLASSMATYNGNVYICYYNESKSFISCSDNFIGIHNGSTENFTAELSLPTNAKYIKLRFYATNVSAIDKSIITLTTK